MKRLNLLYKPKDNEKYPWLLIYPKNKVGLARFQKRSDAIDWFLSFGMEVFIWFHSEKGIFGGQLAVTENEDGKLLTIPKVSGFDGGDTYEEICNEFHIHPSYLTRDAFKEQLAKSVPLIDFELISDVKDYFPPEQEVAKRKQSTYVDLSSIKASLELKIKELENEKNVAAETINDLKSQLETKDFDFMRVNQEIDALKEQKDAEVLKVKEEFENKIEEVREETKKEVLDSINTQETQIPADFEQNQFQQDPYAQQEFDPNANYGSYQEAYQNDPYQGTQQYYPAGDQVAIFDPNAYQIAPYGTNYGYPTNQYQNPYMNYVQQNKKKEVIAWSFIGVAFGLLLIIFILDILVLATYTNALALF